MASIVLPSKGRGYQLVLDLSLASQSVATNTSVVNASLYIIKGSGSGAWTSYTCYWSLPNNSGSRAGFDFRSYTTLSLGTSSFTVAHNPDGTGTANASGSFSETDPSPELGNGTVYASLTLPTIPRATQPSVTPTSGNTGSTFTINHVPAVSTFYHDIAYSLDNGTTYTDIEVGAPGTDTSTDWTPPHSLLPNTTSATAVIRVITYQSSGGTNIGSRTVNLPLTVPASVKPVVSGVSWVDAQTSGPDMPTLMGGAGRFVQAWSRLQPSVTASGAGGSTTVTTRVTQGGQVTSSGVAFNNPVSLSGAVPFTATTTDTRGVVSDPYSNTVAVTAYNFPNLPTPEITRTTDAAGLIPSPIGTYFAITPSASVSDLTFSGSQKNLLEWRIRVKQVGGTYTTVQDWTNATVSGTTWTTKKVIGGGYLASNEYIVEVSIRDLFGKSGYNTSSTIRTLEVLVPSERVEMDWDGKDGIGIGGYRRYGKLDVHGDVYADNLFASETVNAPEMYQDGERVANISDLPVVPVNLPAIVEPGYTDGPAKVYLDGSSSLTPVGYPWLYPYEPEQGDSVLMLPTPGGSFAIGGKLNTRRMFPAQIKLTPLAGWTNYADPTPLADRFSDIKVTRSTEGIVVIAGLLRAGTTTSGTVIAKLPEGFRPDYDLCWPVLSSGVRRLIAIMANGDIKIFGGLGDTSLSGISFPAAGVANWTLLGPGTPYPYQNNWSTDNVVGFNWGPPRIWKEPVTGQVFLQAVVKNAVGNPPDSTVFNIPSSFNAANEELMPTVNSGNTFGYWRTRPSNTDVIIITSGGASGYSNLVPLMANWKPAAGGLMTWTSKGKFSGGWIDYGGIFANVEWAKSPGGIVFLRGLPKNGTMGATIASVEAGYRPKDNPRRLANSGAALITLTVSNSGLGRLDLYANEVVGGGLGAILPIQGNPAWVSFSGQTWAAEQ